MVFRAGCRHQLFQSGEDDKNGDMTGLWWPGGHVWASKVIDKSEITRGERENWGGSWG